MKSKYKKNDMVVFSFRGVMYSGFIKDVTEYNSFETKYMVESGFKNFNMPESDLKRVKFDEPQQTIFELSDPYEDGGL